MKIHVADPGSHPRIKVYDSESGAIRLLSGVSGCTAAVGLMIPCDLIQVDSLCKER